VEQHLRDRGIRPEKLNVVMEMGLMESAKQAAIAGGGVTFVSRSAIGPEVEHGALVVVPVESLEIRREFSMVRSKTRVLSRAAEALLDFLRRKYEAAG
jgi:DNA-binding transcriptional LysR family regulator